MATSAPAVAKALAIAPPISPEPPVTKAVFPLRSIAHSPVYALIEPICWQSNTPTTVTTGDTLGAGYGARQRSPPPYLPPDVHLHTPNAAPQPPLEAVGCRRWFGPWQLRRHT